MDNFDGGMCNLFSLTKDFAVQWDYELTKLREYFKILVLWDGFQEKYGSSKVGFIPECVSEPAKTYILLK